MLRSFWGDKKSIAKPWKDTVSQFRFRDELERERGRPREKIVNSLRMICDVPFLSPILDRGSFIPLFLFAAHKIVTVFEIKVYSRCFCLPWAKCEKCERISELQNISLKSVFAPITYNRYESSIKNYASLAPFSVHFVILGKQL